MRRTLRSRRRSVEILTWSERRPFDSCLAFPDRVVARSFLREFFEDRSTAHSLRRLLADSRPGVARLSEPELVELLAWQLVRGEMMVAIGGDALLESVDTEKWDSSGKSVPPRDPLAGAEPDPGSEASADTAAAMAPAAIGSAGGFAPASNGSRATHWIRFRLVDDETGEPISGVKLGVQLPDGAVGEFETDVDGFVRIDGLPPGKCGIERVTASDTLEVVSLDA